MYVMDCSISEGDREDKYIAWSDILELNGRFTQKELAAYLLFGDTNIPYTHVPDGVAELSYQLLQVKEKDSLADFTVNDGSFLAHCWFTHPQVKMCGFPMSIYDSAVAQIRADLIGAEYFIDEGDYIPETKVNKIFCHFPSTELHIPLIKYKVKEYGIYEDIPEKSSIEWCYSALLLKKLKKGGKVVCIMNGGCLSDRKDSEARKYFLDRGLVGRVIILPEKLFPDKRRRLAMVVFSRDNKKVRFYNATHKASYSRFKGKKIDIIDQCNIDEILNDNSGYSVSLKTISSNGYSLDSAKYYTDEDITIDSNTVPLKSLAADIFRGAQISQAESQSECETDCVWVMPKNIQDGVVLGPWEKFVSHDFTKRLKRYEILQGDVVICRLGYDAKEKAGNSDNTIHYKVAVFEDEGITHKLANDGVFVIRPKDGNTEISYYIKAFLESDLGQKMLALNVSKPKNKSYGGGYKNGVVLSKQVLENLCVPYPDEETRKEIIILCKNYSGEILEAKKKIEKNKYKISELFK